MNETVREWLAKAEGDLHTARREMGAREHENWDAVCYHAQQCIEKLMKALLIDRGVVPPRTHDLTDLDRRLRAVCPQWSCTEDELRFLTRAAVAFRYPDEFAEGQDAAEAMEICERLFVALHGHF